jgi:hypothetical protein
MSNKFFSGKIFSAALIMLAFTAFGCHNNDTTTVTDQSHFYDTSMNNMKPAKSDSSSMDSSNHGPSAIATDTSKRIGTSSMQH